MWRIGRVFRGLAVVLCVGICRADGLSLGTYRGWEGAITLSNAALEAVVVPQTGRIVHLSRPGGENLLRFDDSLAGRLPPEEEGDWLNYGGDWLWPVHQDRWAELAGADWPPMRMLDRPGWQADAFTDADGTLVVSLSRDFGAPLFVHATRELRLSPGDRAELESIQTLRRTQASEVPVCLWQIAQVQGAERVWMGRGGDSGFPDGYRAVKFDVPEPDQIEVCDDAVMYRAGIRGESKLGTDGTWIAAAKAGVAIKLETFDGPEEGVAPDGGCVVTMYSNAGLGYTEIETQTREIALPNGEQMRNRVVYRLSDLEEGLDPCAAAEQLSETARNGPVVNYDPSPAHPGDVIRVTVRTDEPGGILHWGVNGPSGNWELPAEVYRPRGSEIGSSGVAVDSPLPDPVNGVSVLELGPFNRPEQVVESLHAAVRWGDRWESRDGQNFNLEIVPHPQAAFIQWQFSKGGMRDGEVDVTLSTMPEAEELRLYVNGKELAASDSGSLEAKAVADSWRYGPNYLEARAVRKGRLSTQRRTIWKVPEVRRDLVWEEEIPFGASETGSGKWRIHLLAPNARFVELEWKADGRAHREMMAAVGGGRWGLEIDVPSGAPFDYRYLVDGRNRFADPWSRDVVWVNADGEESPLPEHAWTRVGDLPPPRGPDKPAAPPKETWVIYELSIPDVAPPGSYKGLEARLDDIKKLGVNVIEPLPVTAFPGAESWGYNPAFHMAVERAYGTPREFADLVRACQERGIAYVADLVLNHVDASGPLHAMHGEAERNPFTMPFAEFNWGFPKLDQTNAFFKRYQQAVLEAWVHQWGVDGFRYDATQWVKWSGYKDWGASWMSYVVDQADSDVIQIAENLPSEPDMIKGTELDAEWDGHFRWRMRKVLLEGAVTEPEKFREILDPRNHAYQTGWQRVPYIESHDEERFMRELLDHGFSREEAFRRHLAAAAVMLTVPGIPMLYSGQEWGEQTPKVVGLNPLQWQLREVPVRAELEGRFRELIGLRVNHRALHHDRIDLLHLDPETGVVAYRRPGVPESVVVLLNVSNQPRVIELPGAGTPVRELHTDVVPESLEGISLKPGQARIFLVE